MKFCLLVLLFLVGCGESPLLNHDSEKGFSLTDISRAESDDFRFKKSELSFSLAWDQSPHMGENKFTLKIWNSASGTVNGPYVDPTNNLHIFLWMPSMGHGSSPVKITKTQPGVYEVTNVYFIMGGKWELKLQLLNDGKLVDETVLPYTL